MIGRADDPALRAEICEVCRKLWDRGLIAGQDGNVSVRLTDDRVLVTPAGLSKVDVRPEDLIVVTMTGAQTEGSRRASSELGLHLRAYARRPDVQAVVHAHPPTATGWATAGHTIPDDVLPEATVLLGPVPLVPYKTPGTPPLADQFDPYWSEHDVFLMANHGALALGASLRVAHQRMETLEHTARVLTAARGLGGAISLKPEDVTALRAMRNRQMTNE